MTARRSRFEIDSAGIVRAAVQVPSPNCDERPPGAEITLLVVHGISLPPGRFGGPAIAQFFTNRLDPGGHPYFATIAQLRVSAHFLIARDGALTQFVSCLRRAWHAGSSSWRGRGSCNDFSIGVEMEGTDELPYEAAQYSVLASLTRALRRRFPIADLVGHSDVAPGRKTDPGSAFDWPRFQRLVGAHRQGA